MFGCNDTRIFELEIPKELPDTEQSLKWSSALVKNFVDEKNAKTSDISVGDDSNGKCLLFILIFHLPHFVTIMIFIPPEFYGTEVLWLHYLNSTILWISVKNTTQKFGSLVEYDCNKKFMRKIPLKDAENSAIGSFCFVYGLVNLLYTKKS